MVLTVDIPDKIHRRLEAEKKRTGMSKSLLVRRILLAHYAALERRKETAA